MHVRRPRWRHMEENNLASERAAARAACAWRALARLSYSKTRSFTSFAPHSQLFLLKRMQSRLDLPPNETLRTVRSSRHSSRVFTRQLWLASVSQKLRVEVIAEFSRVLVGRICRTAQAIFPSQHLTSTGIVVVMSQPPKEAVKLDEAAIERMKENGWTVMLYQLCSPQVNSESLSTLSGRK